jgi:hypothetical protein
MKSLSTVQLKNSVICNTIQFGKKKGVVVDIRKQGLKRSVVIEYKIGVDKNNKPVWNRDVWIIRGER